MSTPLSLRQLWVLCFLFLCFYWWLAHLGPSNLGSSAAPPLSAANVRYLTTEHDQLPGVEVTGEAALQQTPSQYLVYFYQPQCKNCVAFGKGTLTDYAQTGGALPIFRVDLSQPREQSSWKTYEIAGTPTILAVADGKVVKRFLGASTSLHDLQTSFSF